MNFTILAMKHSHKAISVWILIVVLLLNPTPQVRGQFNTNLEIGDSFTYDGFKSMNHTVNDTTYYEYDFVYHDLGVEVTGFNDDLGYFHYPPPPGVEIIEYHNGVAIESASIIDNWWNFIPIYVTSANAIIGGYPNDSGFGIATSLEFSSTPTYFDYFANNNVTFYQGFVNSHMDLQDFLTHPAVWGSNPILSNLDADHSNVVMHLSDNNIFNFELSFLFTNTTQSSLGESAYFDIGYNLITTIDVERSILTHCSIILLYEVGLGEANRVLDIHESFSLFDPSSTQSNISPPTDAAPFTLSFADVSISYFSFDCFKNNNTQKYKLTCS